MTSRRDARDEQIMRRSQRCHEIELLRTALTFELLTRCSLLGGMPSESHPMKQQT